MVFVVLLTQILCVLEMSDVIVPCTLVDKKHGASLGK